MRAVFFIFILLGLASCGSPDARKSLDKENKKPARIVSLDYCSDQFVLKFVDPENILGVSPDATRDFSYMRNTAVGLPIIRPVAEDVLISKPDLVVRSYGGGPNAAEFFERAGIPVLNVGWANDIESVITNIERMAEGLGEEEKGVEVLEQMQSRLDAIKRSPHGKSALYLTPSGVTSGPGALIHDILLASGYSNFQPMPGWRSLPMERLAYEQPDMVAAGFFSSVTNHRDAWSPMKHPVAKKQLARRETVYLEGAWLACGGWFLMEAVDALVEAAAAGETSVSGEAAE